VKNERGSVIFSFLVVLQISFGFYVGFKRGRMAIVLELDCPPGIVQELARELFSVAFVIKVLSST